MTYRVWLTTGRYKHVTAPTEKDAVRKLTRTERQRVTKVTLVKP